MMGFWDLFKEDDKNNKIQTGLFHELKTKLPNASENELIFTACISGLLARIAYVDFKVTDEEVNHIEAVLKEWTEFSNEMIEVIREVSIKHIKELAGLENHMYVHHLKPLIDKNERYKVVEALFALAASDGIVENIESEEIRIVVKGFDLSDQHFLAARATVAKKLGALKK